MVPQPVKKMGLAVHPHHERAERALRILKASAEAHGIEIVEYKDACGAEAVPPCQVIVSVGGDGTLLASVHKAYQLDIPVWGINVGHLGFLTASGVDEIEEGVKRLSKGDYMVERRTMLEAEITGTDCGTVKTVALNDVVVHRDIVGGGLTLDVELDGRFLVTYDGDGVIVSTPTGSTAYSLSAGGPILSPSLKALLLVPICSHSLSARSLVFDEDSVLTIKPRFLLPRGVAHVTSDGKAVCVMRGGEEWHEIENEDKNLVKVRKASHTAALVRFQDLVFPEILREKLGWAGVSPLKRNK